MSLHITPLYTAPPSPDAELVALLSKWSERISKVWIGHAHLDELITIQREIDAKLAEVKGVRNDDVPKPD